jgi:hypothetical protein
VDAGYDNPKILAFEEVNSLKEIVLCDSESSAGFQEV